MFVGHYSVSFAFKKADASIPLWSLFLAVQFLDIMWSLFVFLGIEKADIDIHNLPANPLNLYYMPFTHSFFGALFWSAIVYIILASFFKDPNKRRKATVLSIAVFSHWLLDLIVHIQDLPLWNNSFKIGFGLYHSAIGTFLVESILLVVGVIIYYKVIQKHQRNIKPLLFFILFLILLCGNTIWGIKPPTTNIAAGFLLSFYFLNALIIYFLEKNLLVSKKEQYLNA